MLRNRNRKSIRLQGYDYSQPGWYFLTICTLNHENLFGSIRNGRLEATQSGVVAYTCWNQIPCHFVNVLLDAFVVMPNHVHGIVRLIEVQEAVNGEGTDSYRLAPGSLPIIVRSYKAAVTRMVNAMKERQGSRMWQRSYYERIVRNEKELLALRRYILDNPVNWKKDKYHPVYVGS